MYWLSLAIALSADRQVHQRMGLAAVHISASSIQRT